MINKFVRNWKATKRPTEQSRNAVNKWLNKLAEKEKEKKGGKDE